MKKNNIKIIFTPKDHPSSNGLVERVNKTLCDRIRQKIYETKTNQTKAWSVLAEQAVNEYNQTIHSTTKYSPLYLLTGYDPDELFDDEDVEQARKIALENSKDAHHKQKLAYDFGRTSLDLKRGDEIYISKGNPLNRKKLDPCYEGPYPVQKVKGQAVVEVNRNGRLEAVHVSKIKPKRMDDGLKNKALFGYVFPFMMLMALIGIWCFLQVLKFQHQIR